MVGQEMFLAIITVLLIIIGFLFGNWMRQINQRIADTNERIRKTEKDYGQIINRLARIEGKLDSKE